MAVLAPKKGDFVSYFFDEQSGREQRGRRPALVISNDSFNQMTGIVFVCPVTTADRGYPFHIVIPRGSKITGVVIVDQLKAIDYRDRQLRFMDKSPVGLLEQTLAMLDRIMN